MMSLACHAHGVRLFGFLIATFPCFPPVGDSDSRAGAEVLKGLVTAPICQAARAAAPLERVIGDLRIGG